MFFKFLTLFLVALTSVWAGIQECSSIKEVLQERAENTLFIFDIDNTILRPSQLLGSDEWVENSIKKKKLEGASDDVITRTVLDLWTSIIIMTHVRLLEKDTPHVIYSLQKEKHPIIILTSRPDYIAATTMHQLKTLGIDVTKTAPIQTKLSLQQLPRSIVFQDGIIYTWGQEKGKALLQFLKNLTHIPQKIVVIDDKKTHLENIEKMVFSEYTNTITFTGLRYSGADAIVKSYDEAVAAKELEHFMKGIISDKEAA